MAEIEDTDAASSSDTAMQGVEEEAQRTGGDVDEAKESIPSTLGDSFYTNVSQNLPKEVCATASLHPASHLTCASRF